MTVVVNPDTEEAIAEVPEDDQPDHAQKWKTSAAHPHPATSRRT